MSELRPFVLVRTGDQWVRSSFESTFLDLSEGIVELAWIPAATVPDGSAPTLGAGLAFDSGCRLYHSLPGQGRVERLRWSPPDTVVPPSDRSVPVDLFGAGKPGAFGDFTAPAEKPALCEPRGLAVDQDDRLFVAESGRDRLLVYDLWSRRLLQRIALPAGSRPTDLAVSGRAVYAVLAGSGQIVRFRARSTPIPLALPPGCTGPSRLAVSPSGRLAILERVGTAAARVWFNEPQFRDFPVDLATDLEWESDSVLVVARQPGADFLRFEVGAGQRVEGHPLRARGYDGLGIAALPSAAGSSGSFRRIGYWTGNGLHTAVPARLVYERRGRVTSYRLDSGAYQTVWGRLFVDACIPEGTAVRVHAIVLDEAEEEIPLARIPPANAESLTLRRPDLSPPMPPATLVPGAGEVSQDLHRRESGRELPWTQPAAGDPYATYEAPIAAPPGRYLWITLELLGNTRTSPRIKCLRAEHPAHDYLRRLPRTFSRDPAAASFLLRYLAMFEGFLGELEALAVERHRLFETRTAPDEVLPWLASFLGLVLDERWAAAPSPHDGPPADVRRTYIREMAWLFRYRGTAPGLRRFIEIYTGVPVVIIEHFRLRGAGAAVLGDTGAAFSSSVLGFGFRVGGAVGAGTAAALEGSAADAFRTRAHRFTVIIPAVLTPEQLEVVAHLIEIHRPAHTLFDLCSVGAGMRVGRGLLTGITSVIGPTGGFAPLRLGGSALGRGTLVGHPEAGTRPGSSTLGWNSTVA